MKIQRVGPLLLILALFGGCRHRTKRASRPHISRLRSHDKQNLQLEVSHASAEACTRNFGIDLTDHGYVVLDIHMVNHGGDRYAFRPSYSDIPRLSLEHLADMVYYDTSTRCIWLSLPSLLLWWPAIPLVVVPCGMYWSQENQRLERQIRDRVIGPDTRFKILPYETVDRSIIVPEELWGGKFSIGFFDEKSDELVRFAVSFT